MKPAEPTYTHSYGTPLTYVLHDGRTAEVRNGCLVDAATRETIKGSDEAADYVLRHAKLSPEDRRWIADWGRWVFPFAGRQAMSRAEAMHSKT